MILVGLGYALAGNVPGIFLVASWFPATSSRMIGLYLMIGAAGNVVGPPLVSALVAARLQPHSLAAACAHYREPCRE
jgi:hypothetical protein